MLLYRHNDNTQCNNNQRKQQKKNTLAQYAYVQFILYGQNKQTLDGH